MRIEQKVCTVEQGRQLAVLGVTASERCWVKHPTTGEWMVSILGHEAMIISRPGPTYEFYPAFDVAELMLALINDDVGYGYSVCYRHPFFVAYSITERVSNMDEKFEHQAHAMAHLLIHIMKDGYVTAEAVNKKLFSHVS